jgi:hypothetical protein
MDQIVSKIAALGVPGLILVVVMSVSGFAGAVAITSSLAVLGGPFGMLGGIAVLGVLGLISQGIAEFGVDQIFRGVVDELRKQGKSKSDIEREVNKYPISGGLKSKIKEYLNNSN